MGIHQQSHDNAEAVSEVQKHATAAKNTKVRKVSVDTSQKDTELYEIVKQLKKEMEEMRKSI